MAEKVSLKETGKGLLGFLPELVKPQLRGYLETIESGEDFELDLDAMNQTKRNALKYLLNQGIEGISKGKLGLSSGIGLEYRPNERYKYYAEKRPGGFQLGGTLYFK
jgi:hypothetical protein